jgi:hypothetical protein
MHLYADDGSGRTVPPSRRSLAEKSPDVSSVRVAATGTAVAVSTRCLLIAPQSLTCARHLANVQHPIENRHSPTGAEKKAVLQAGICGPSSSMQSCGKPDELDKLDTPHPPRAYARARTHASLPTLATSRSAPRARARARWGANLANFQLQQSTKNAFVTANIREHSPRKPTKPTHPLPPTACPRPRGLTP